MEQLEIVLPTFHSGQFEAYQVWKNNKRVAGRCGRRFGKTQMAQVIACDAIIKGRNVGWFAPTYRILSEAYNEISGLVNPIKMQSSKTEGVIRTTTSGRIDFWTLENPSAGRSRKYHLIIVDEGAFAKEDMIDIWERAIEPTLLDYADLPYGGRCLVISNTNGISDKNFFYRICNDTKYGFAQFHMPSHRNPYLPKAEIEKLEATTHPLVYQQEYLAEFVDFSGVAFFPYEKFLVNKQPVNFPAQCDTVIAVIDTAVKDGQEHDATAVSFYALMPSWFEGYRLVILDWDLALIKGALLEDWIPWVYLRLEELATLCKALFPSPGVWIEDAQSGSILLQQCELRGLPARALPSQLTSLGKDARAINISGAVFRGDVKISRYALEKQKLFKGFERNHFISQVSGFRIGDKDAHKRSDDLLDTLTYSIAVTLGNSKGIA